MSGFPQELIWASDPAASVGVTPSPGATRATRRDAHHGPASLGRPPTSSAAFFIWGRLTRKILPNGGNEEGKGNRKRCPALSVQPAANHVCRHARHLPAPFGFPRFFLFPFFFFFLFPLSLPMARRTTPYLGSSMEHPPPHTPRGRVPQSTRALPLLAAGALPVCLPPRRGLYRSPTGHLARLGLSWPAHVDGVMDPHTA